MLIITNNILSDYWPNRLLVNIEVNIIINTCNIPGTGSLKLPTR